MYEIEVNKALKEIDCRVGDIVYLVTDTDQSPKQITNISLDIYINYIVVSYCLDDTYYERFRFTKEKNVLLTTSN